MRDIADHIIQRHFFYFNRKKKLFRFTTESNDALICNTLKKVVICSSGFQRILTFDLSVARRTLLHALLVLACVMASRALCADASASATGHRKTYNNTTVHERNFHEREIAQNVEGSTSGIAVDRVPIATQPYRRRRWHRKRHIRHDSDLVVAKDDTVFTKSVSDVVSTAEPASELWFTTDASRSIVASSGVIRTLRQNHSTTGFSPCENNGTFVNGKCRCYFPYVGERCADFACEHGLSVGPRYDPESLFFNRKCICDEDWAGEFCNIPIADQCNERGQYIRGRCKCHGYYFGPKCQYVGKCVNGKLQEGVCQCQYGYEGDYCDKIVCHHGYPDKSNGSHSCVCPPRHSGMFCDECAATGDYILPYPNCTEERIPHRARMSRQKTDDQLMARFFILAAALFLLLMLLAAMFVMHWGRRRAEQYDVNGVQLARDEQRVILAERRQLLEQAIHMQAMPAVQRSPLDVTLSLNGSPTASGCLGTTRRNSRFADSKRMDNNLL